MKKHYLLYLFSLWLPLCVMAQSSEVWYSTQGGEIDEEVWSTQSHDGSATQSANCRTSGTRTLRIQHEITTDCQTLESSGYAQIIVEDGGRLVVEGVVDAYGDSKIHVEDGGEFVVLEDLVLSGNASLTINGRLSIYGDAVVRGQAQACGTGEAMAYGMVTGEGWCYDITTVPTNGITMRASYDLTRGVSQVTWKIDPLLRSGQMILERSTNGMTFSPIKTYDLGAFEPNQLHSYKDEKLDEGIVYYRVSRLLKDGERRMSQIATVRMSESETDNCLLEVNPNPCVPSCFATLVDCPSGLYETYIMDASGQVVSELMRLNQDGDIKYHINKDNFLTPGVYVISASNASTNKSKKVIIK